MEIKLDIDKIISDAIATALDPERLQKLTLDKQTDWNHYVTVVMNQRPSVFGDFQIHGPDGRVTALRTENRK